MNEEMGGKPVVSVIMAAYGQAAYVAEALESVMAQTFPDWEVIVVDDGSPDNVADVVKAYTEKDSRIKFFHTDNHGVSAARNFAVSKSEGEYLLPLDADDTIEPAFLERCLCCMRDEPSTDVVYTQWKFFGSTTRTRDLYPYTSYSRELIENAIPVTALMRKPRFLEIGGYDEKMLTGLEDWEFWLRYLDEDSKVTMLPERLLNYRQKEVSRNTEGALGLKGYDNEMYMLSKHKEKYSRVYGNPIKAIRYKRKYYNIWYKRLWYKLSGKRKRLL